MELPADGQVWLSNGLFLFFLGLFVCICGALTGIGLESR